MAGLRLHVRSLKGFKKEVGGALSGPDYLVNNPDRVSAPTGSNVRPLDLATKDVQLVTDHDDLEILGGLALAIWDQQP